MKEINKLEEIYPLTIVSRRFGGFAIVNCNCDAACVNSLEGDEELHYGDSAIKFMDKEWFGVKYGLGKTIEKAYEDYKNRNK